MIGVSEDHMVEAYGGQGGIVACRSVIDVPPPVKSTVYANSW